MKTTTSNRGAKSSQKSIHSIARFHIYLGYTYLYIYVVLPALIRSTPKSEAQQTRALSPRLVRFLHLLSLSLSHSFSLSPNRLHVLQPL